MLRGAIELSCVRGLSIRMQLCFCVLQSAVLQAQSVVWPLQMRILFAPGFRRLIPWCKILLTELVFRSTL